MNIIQEIIAETRREKFLLEKRQFGASVGVPKDFFNDEQRELVWEDDLKKFLDHNGMDGYLRLDAAPVPSAADREGYYGERHFAYWLSGLYDYLKIIAHFQPRPDSALLDWGGASGRVSRHFSAYHLDMQVTVADINRNHVDYINDIFRRPNLRGVKISSLPYLSFPDNAFDLICGFSVFTHIDAYETGWLSELARVLKPGGMAYFTIHSEKDWELLSPEIPVYNAIKNHPSFPLDWQPGQRMPEERMVFPSVPGIDYSCNIFLHTRHILKVWSKFFHIKEIVYRGTILQDVVILTK